MKGIIKAVYKKGGINMANDEDVSKVFGNDPTVTEQEEAKAKENETESEEHESNESTSESEETTDTPNEENSDSETVEDADEDQGEIVEEEQSVKTFDSRYAKSEMKAFMAIAGGIVPNKVPRAVNLITLENVMENGEFSEEKAQAELEELLKDWPELKQVETEKNVFHFGAKDQDEGAENKRKSAISKIFGN